MKKILLVLVLILFTTGCMRVDKTDIEDLSKGILASKSEVYNRTNSGFKYYLPKNLRIVKCDEYNVVLKSKDYEYYLYVDLVAYFNKTKINYKTVDNAVYSLLIGADDKNGVINVLSKDDKFLVQVSYNYATMQVVVGEKDVKSAITNALIITSTIKYNDDVIKKLLEENEFSSSDEIVNIFDKRDENTDSLGVVENITGDDNKTNYDPDYIN